MGEIWLDVNTALGGAGPLILADGKSRNDLVTLQASLEDARDAVTDLGVDRALARGQLDAQIAVLQARAVDFNERVRADLPESPYANALVPAFSVGDAEDAVRDGLRKISRLWSKVNAITPAPPGLTLPLVMQDGFTLAQFDALRLALRDAYRTLSDAEVDLSVARGKRNDLQDIIYPILKGYRQKVPTKFPAGAALVMSLPALTPTPGRTPDAVTAQAAWVAASSQAKISWAASAEADLEKYEVRAVPGDDYNAEDETVLATVLPGAARELLTDFALGSAGLTAGFKVYVMLTTGNEKGSDAVYVTRPG